MKIERRDFLKTSLLAGAAAIAPKSVFSQNADSKIEILINEPIGTIHPDIYGHDAVLLGELQKTEDLSDNLLFVTTRTPLQSAAIK